jgi:hypothetical protein
LEAWLPPDAVQHLADQFQLGQRRRVLTPVTTTFLFVKQILNGNTACSDPRHLSGRVWVQFPLANATQSVCGRRVKMKRSWHSKMASVRAAEIPLPLMTAGAIMLSGLPTAGRLSMPIK